MLMSAKARTVAASRDRYSTVAIALHWLIAAGIVLQIAMGWRMGDLEGLGHSFYLQLHKSIGITVLVLTVARLAWRIVNPPPPHGSNLTPLEAKASHWVHIGFYAALLAMPLTGWAMVSLERASAFTLFNVIPWPAFPLVNFLPAPVQDVLSDLFGSVHANLAWVMIGLLALHVAGALKHHFISKDPTLSRMAPGVQPGAILEPRLLAIPVVAVALAAVIYLPKPPEAVARPRVAVLANADLYADIVGPALNHRCAGCHSDDQSKGGLSVSTFDSIMQGGRHGPVIKPGDVKHSELYRRITLPGDDKLYMPQDGKPPLSKSEMTAVAFWISQGAPRSVKVGALKVPADVEAALKTLIGSGEGEDQIGLSSGEPLPTVPAIDKAQTDKLVSEGFIVRKVSNASNLVVVDYILPKPITPEAIADLAKSAPQILNLNLRRSGVTDAEVKTVTAFPNLRILRLERNDVTDAAAKDIAAMPHLVYVNLSNTKVTDAGVQTLTVAPKLTRVFVWGTAVTAGGVEKVKATRKDMFVDTGLTAKDVPVETKMLTPAN